MGAVIIPLKLIGVLQGTRMLNCLSACIKKWLFAATALVFATEMKTVCKNSQLDIETIDLYVSVAPTYSLLMIVITDYAHILGMDNCVQFWKP